MQARFFSLLRKTAAQAWGAHEMKMRYISMSERCAIFHVRKIRHGFWWPDGM